MLEGSSGDPQSDLPLSVGPRPALGLASQALSQESLWGQHVLPQHEGLRLSGAGGGCHQPDLLLSKPFREAWQWVGTVVVLGIVALHKSLIAIGHCTIAIGMHREMVSSQNTLKIHTAKWLHEGL